MKEDERYIGSLGNRPCPMGCIYCFVENENYKGISKIDSKDRIEIDTEAKIIQPSCDVEFFLIENWEKKLKDLGTHQKSISFATKAKLSNRSIKQIALLNDKLQSYGELINIAVSLTSFRVDWKEIEHFTPSPDERLKTLKQLYKAGIKTTVAIRPLLPFLTTEDLIDLVEKTYKFTFGYLLGPLYLTPRMKNYLIKKGEYYQVLSKKVSWLPIKTELEYIQSIHLEEDIKGLSKKYNLPVFENNIEAVKYVKKISQPPIE